MSMWIGIHLHFKWPAPKNHLPFPSSALKPGHVLDNFTENVWTYMPDDAAVFVDNHICHLPHELAFGFMCSGSDMDHAAALSLEKCLHGLGTKTKFTCVFNARRRPRSADGWQDIARLVMIRACTPTSVICREEHGLVTRRHATFRVATFVRRHTLQGFQPH